MILLLFMLNSYIRWADLFTLLSLSAISVLGLVTNQRRLFLYFWKQPKQYFYVRIHYYRVQAMVDWLDVQRQWWKIHRHLLKQIRIIAILCDGNDRDYISTSIKPNNHWHLARTLLNLVPLKLSLVGQFWGDPIMHKSCKDDLLSEKAPQQWCCLLCTCTVVLFTLTDREKVRNFPLELTSDSKLIVVDDPAGTSVGVFPSPLFTALPFTINLS